jgi:DNA-binding response OmpR family regulator
MAKSNVLVVEDDDTIRQLLVEYLREHEHVRVDAARDGVEALHLLSVEGYGVMVLDVMMPKMSGVDLLDSVQAMTSDPSLKALEAPPPVIIITSTSASVLPSEALKKRFPSLVHAVFRKPLEMDPLGACVATLLRR